jgi:DNA-directed RNA polymerase subunit RPC12/RpoP
MNDDNVLTCPYCGNDMRIESDINIYYKCIKCGARGPKAFTYKEALEKQNNQIAHKKNIDIEYIHSWISENVDLSLLISFIDLFNERNIKNCVHDLNLERKGKKHFYVAFNFLFFIASMIEEKERTEKEKNYCIFYDVAKKEYMTARIGTEKSKVLIWEGCGFSSKKNANKAIDIMKDYYGVNLLEWLI